MKTRGRSAQCGLNNPASIVLSVTCRFFARPPKDFCTQLCGLRNLAMGINRSYSPARRDPHEAALSKGTFEVYCGEPGHRLTRRNDGFPGRCGGGIRRGSDAFKALAMGATAVGMGRPVLWGLGAFGQPGVERVLDIVNRELRITMGSCGCAKLGDVNIDYIGRQPA